MSSLYADLEQVNEVIVSTLTRIIESIDRMKRHMDSDIVFEHEIGVVTKCVRSATSYKGYFDDLVEVAKEEDPDRVDFYRLMVFSPINQLSNVLESAMDSDDIGTRRGRKNVLRNMQKALPATDDAIVWLRKKDL